MAGRPNKDGLEYFALDCHMEDKIKLIQAEFGLKGFAIVVKLYQKIYGERGYYCEWNEDVLFLFMSENGVNSDGKNLIAEIITACIKRNIFSKDLFEKYGILTSAGIQKRYLMATNERKQIEMKKEYLLISVPKNRNNVVINSINRSNNSINRSRNEQSKVKESKEYKNHCASETHDDETKLSKEEQLKHNFEIIYAIYPKKRGKTAAFACYKSWVTTGKDVGCKKYRLTNRQIYKAVQKYVKQQEEDGQDDYQYWKNFDTLMGRQLLDYVDWEEEK